MALRVTDKLGNVLFDVDERTAVLTLNGQPLTFPSTLGASGQVLTTDGHGVTSWGAADGTVVIDSSTETAYTGMIYGDGTHVLADSNITTNGGGHLTASVVTATADGYSTTIDLNGLATDGSITATGGTVTAANAVLSSTLSAATNQFTVDGSGNCIATSFFGDGSGLGNIQGLNITGSISLPSGDITAANLNGNLIGSYVTGDIYVQNVNANVNAVISGTLSTDSGAISTDGGGVLSAFGVTADSLADSGGYFYAGGGSIYMANLPTEDPHDANRIWSDGGTVKISAG